MVESSSEGLARGAMVASACLMTLLGLSAGLAAEPLGAYIGLGPGALRILVAPLLAIAFHAWYHARLQRLQRVQVWGLAGIHVTFALGCLGLVVVAPPGLTPIGRGGALLVAAILLLLAFLQAAGLRRAAI